MRYVSAVVCVFSAVLCLSVALDAQQTRQEAIAGMRKTLPKEMDATYTTAAPKAQKLVDEALAKHPEVILLAIHAQPAGHPNVIVASNFGRIGKIGDDDDMRCINTGKPNLAVEPNGTHYEAELVLRDKAGKTIGALGVVFNYKPGEDPGIYHRIADEIEAEMRAQLPHADSLFAPS